MCLEGHWTSLYPVRPDRVRHSLGDGWTKAQRAELPARRSLGEGWEGYFTMRRFIMKMFIALSTIFASLQLAGMQQPPQPPKLRCYGPELYRAVTAQNSSAVDALLQQPDVDLNWRDSYGNTPLICAAFNNNAELVSMLVAAGADPNLHTDLGNSALFNTKSFCISRILIESGAQVNARNKDRSTALMKAAAAGELDTAKFLLHHGSLIDTKNAHGCTALMLAAGHGKKELVKLLLSAGADYTAREKNGLTAAEIAVDNGHTDVAATVLTAFLIEAFKKKLSIQ